MKLHVNDKEFFDFSPSSRQYTDNGFLRVSGKAARAGCVYQYLASEMTDVMPDGVKPNDIINVYRPSDEVFKTESLGSYANVDVTNNHPSKQVDAKNYKYTSVGHVISAKQDGDFVLVDMIVKDAGAIQDIERGKVQLSPGYETKYVPEKGVAPCGTAYDYKQTDIAINHVAIVQRGRGGEQVRLHDKGVVTKMAKIMLDSGRSIEIEDGAIAALVSDSIERLVKSDTDSKNALDAAQAERDSFKEKLATAELAATDEAIAKRVADIAVVQSNALKIAGETFSCDSVDTLTIQRAALQKVRPATDWAAKSEPYVMAAFDMSLQDSAKAPAKNVTDQLDKLAIDIADEDKKPKINAYDAHKTAISNAWKGDNK
jgi:hypothetical protein